MKHTSTNNNKLKIFTHMIRGIGRERFNHQGRLVADCWRQTNAGR